MLHPRFGVGFGRTCRRGPRRESDGAVRLIGGIGFVLPITEVRKRSHT